MIIEIFSIMKNTSILPNEQFVKTNLNKKNVLTNELYTNDLNE